MTPKDYIKSVEKGGLKMYQPLNTTTKDRLQ
jgi:hypothetical protein